MSEIILKQISSLEKVFLNDTDDKKEIDYATMLKGERYSYQLMYRAQGAQRIKAKVSVNTDMNAVVTVRQVGNVPSELPVDKSHCDDDFITKEPGLFPDPLYPIEDEINVDLQAWRSLWITIETTVDTKPGIYKVEVSIEDTMSEISSTSIMQLEVINAILPKQELIYTQWFHADCIATYYKYDVFSEQHWSMIDKFMKAAANTGINMLLTPVLTPPLDTKVRGERPTVQLVAVEKNGNGYVFDFSKLERWIMMAQKNGIEYFEIAHFFSQWGAKYAPKVVANISGKEIKIFGWETSASSTEYVEFLNALIPQLLTVLKKLGIADKTYFHVSDEPSAERNETETYRTAYEIVKELLEGYPIIDALSDYDFYELGLIKRPIPSNDAINEFIAHGVKDLWTYYCCGQTINVSNRFMAMPSYRNRIIGTQLYKYDIKGFLHWGFNFYYSQFSVHSINPFLTTDAEYAFPSGDSFSVYPYENGPIESIRSVVFYEALQDLRAFKLLETYIGKTEVIKLIEEGIEHPVTFEEYPRNKYYLIELREKVNRIIKNYVGE